MDSFPASDPPGWIRTVAAPSESTVNPPDTLFEVLPHLFARNRTVLLAGAALGALVIAGAVFFKLRA